MVRTLLICGLLAGLLAGVCAFGFQTVAGEPAIDEAIAFEEATAKAGADEEELVSRDTQRGFGLLTASVVYGVAMGGIFAIVFAVGYGRIGRGRMNPLHTGLLLAATAFVVVFLVPFLKYPPNPPAVGDPETIGERTALYLVMIWISICAAVAAWRLRQVCAGRVSGDLATVGGALTYAAICTAAALSLPSADEIPANFPADTLWRFREASLGTQFVMWASIGVVFAFLAQRVMSGQGLPRPRRAPRPAAAPGD